MKRLVKLVVFLLVLLTASLAWADEWTYAGRFVLRHDMHHSNDVFILNHLVQDNGQPIGTGSGQYMPYDVYYYHDHDNDKVFEDENVCLVTFNIQGKVVPLNVYGKPMEHKGEQCGTIVSDIDVKNAGTFGVKSQGFRVFDRVTHELLFEASGKMGYEQLYKNSAAEAILRLSAPHPVPHWSEGPMGSVYYKYR